jgi:Secretion system C-terminal sorting domain
MIKKFTYALLVIFATYTGISQESLVPLHSNLNYVYKDLKAQTIPAKSNPMFKTQAASLPLPFIEDFFYAPNSNYPDQNKWSDSSAYINTGYPIQPPSIGVATFDGLNKFGFPYQPNLINVPAGFPADTLTSASINLFTTITSQTLQPLDSVALTFYYQARGNGEAPEVYDSLIVDAFKPKQKAWANSIWAVRGYTNSNTTDSVFKYVFISLADTAYLHDGFKFRFRNKANTNGNYDHWHVDYIYLDKNLSQSGIPNFKDVTFLSVPTPLLKNYSAMPYQQYASYEMDQKNLVSIRNNFNGSLNLTYESSFFNDSNNNNVHSYNGGSQNTSPGKVTYPNFATPPFSYAFSPLPDSVDYRIEHYVFESAVPTDFISENNKVTQYQRFRNYYALDDGSAEAGYYVNSAGAKIAVKINVNVPDSFLAVRIYFDPIGPINAAVNSTGFRINVWQAGTNGPGSLLFRDTIFKPQYFSKAPTNSFPEYRLIRPKYLNPGTYYIGIQQLADEMIVGFDKNVDHRTSTYYDAGSGWTQSAIFGSIMIRPVFGVTLPPPVGISENEINPNQSFFIYPNPSFDQFIIRKKDLTKPSTYSLINAMGQQIINGTLIHEEEIIKTSELSSGIYFLILNTNSERVQQQKIIIQH